MQMLDLKSICALAQCNKSLKSDAQNRFVFATQIELTTNSKKLAVNEVVGGKEGYLLQYHPKIRVYDNWKNIKTIPKVLLGNIAHLVIQKSIDREIGLKEVFTSMRGLRELTLLHGKLETRTARRLFKVLREREKRNNGLHELCLIFKIFRNDAMISLASYVADAKSLEKLDFSSCTFKKDSLLNLVDGIVKNKSIKTLNLNCQDLGSHPEIALSKILRGCPTLIELDLAATCRHFSSQDWETIASAIMDDNCNLQSLSFGLGWSPSEHVAIILAPLITKLHRLEITASYFSGQGVRAIGRAIGASKTITHCHVRLGGDLKQFALDIAPNKSLEVFNLNNCKIGTEGLLHLKGAFAGKTELRKLRLEGNNIDDAGCQYIAELLISCPSLEIIRLGTNKIGACGVRTIAAALPQAKNLQRLFLGGNNEVVDDASAAELFRAVYDHPSLSCLVISVCADGFKIGELATPALEALKPGIVLTLRY
jgi:Ran GTPase-activating protein (RanGAP) involved in mRNA processing and transport